MKFHENLRRLRKEAGLSQEDVAQKLFLTRQSISKWENGSAEPGIEHLKALAKLYVVTLDELVDSEDECPTPEAVSEQKDDVWAYMGLLAARAVMLVAILLICEEYGYQVKDQWYSFADIFVFVVGFWITRPVIWVLLMCIQMFAAIFGLIDLVTMGSFPALISIFCNGILTGVLYVPEQRKRFHAEKY